ncbi:MAG: polyprenyl synthetase family protein [Clostridia bacterium]|nr:polyprenyl synthetase family protein [Clostridia bacterium]
MKEALAEYRNIFERQLQDVLAQYLSDIQPISEALVYAVSNGGKRIRPTLCYLGADFCRKDSEYVKNLAVGIEMIHSYSLVHDDMPCMDDDDLRRGKPTAHKVYGEGMAMLAGDALLNMAFEVMLGDYDFDKNTLGAMRYVAKMCGIKGMIGGQCLDLANESKENFGIKELTRLNRLKTSCLIRAALVGSAILCGADAQEVQALEIYAQNLGEIFQIVDDILDRTSTEQELGKQVKQDIANDKKSVVDILGIDGAKEYIKKLEDEAVKSISVYGQRAQKLIELCKFLSNRSN